MNKFIYIFLFLFISPLSVFTQSSQSTDFRNRLKEARWSKQDSEQLYRELAKIDINDSELLTIQANCCLVQCIHTKNWAKQMKLISQAREKLNHALQVNPKNIEARVLRFVMDSETAQFFKNQNHHQEDKLYIKAHFKLTDFSSIPYRTVEELYQALSESNQFSKLQLLEFQKEVISYQKKLSKQ